MAWIAFALASLLALLEFKAITPPLLKHLLSLLGFLLAGAIAYKKEKWWPLYVLNGAGILLNFISLSRGQFSCLDFGLILKGASEVVAGRISTGFTVHPFTFVLFTPLSFLNQETGCLAGTVLLRLGLWAGSLFAGIKSRSAAQRVAFLSLPFLPLTQGALYSTNLNALSAGLLAASFFLNPFLQGLTLGLLTLFKPYFFAPPALLSLVKRPKTRWLAALGVPALATLIVLAFFGLEPFLAWREFVSSAIYNEVFWHRNLQVMSIAKNYLHLPKPASWAAFGAFAAVGVGATAYAVFKRLKSWESVQALGILMPYFFSAIVYPQHLLFAFVSLAYLTAENPSLSFCLALLWLSKALPLLAPLSLLGASLLLAFKPPYDI